MLSDLRIKNLAVISELELEFGRGLNILTGETGAGKSMVLRAIDLLGGSRAVTDLIRHGTERLEVEGRFVLDEGQLAALPEAIRENADGTEFVVRRTIDASGRSKGYINGRLAGVSELQGLAQCLVSITGQHQQQSLLDPSYQRRLLDSFGVEPACIERVESAWRSYAEDKRLFDEFVKESSSKDEYFRRIGFEYEELTNAKIRTGEREALEEQALRLSSVENLAACADQVLQMLEDDESGILHVLRRAEGILGGAVALDKRLVEQTALLESARIQLQEAGRGLADYGASLEGDPARLEACRERIAELARLERKYGRSTADLAEYCRRIGAELTEYHGGAFNLEKLQERCNESAAALRRAEQALSASRKEAADKLPALVERELAQLNMKRARFAVEITPCPSGPSGADSVQFMLAPNPGEPFKPLARTASGGELARVLLILKTLLHERASTALQIFDEVDSGVGGAVAQVVGERLKTLAADSQVLLITHAPQIASLADHHFLIAKTSSADKTETHVRLLTPTERVTEVARMLAGKKITSTFEGSARELLKHKTH